MNRLTSLISKARLGDKASEEIIVSENMPLVHSCVKKLCRDNTEYEDLLQLGLIGLVKAIRRFDTGYNVMFSTYAVPLIMGEIRRFQRDDGMIKVSRGLKETAQKAGVARRELCAKLGTEPTINHIASHIGVTTENLLMALDACLPYESLQKSLSVSDGKELTLADTISDSSSNVDVLEKIALKTALAKLSARERKIIILRYFKDKTQGEISKLVGVSQVQVSRIEKKVLSLLREELN